MYLQRIIFLQPAIVAEVFTPATNRKDSIYCYIAGNLVTKFQPFVGVQSSHNDLACDAWSVKLRWSLINESINLSTYISGC